MTTVLGRIDFLPEGYLMVSPRFCFIQGGAKSYFNNNKSSLLCYIQDGNTESI